MPTAFLDYLGPADRVTLERAAGLSMPVGTPPATEHTRQLAPSHTVATIILHDIPEARLHVLARLYAILAELPLPEVPVQDMEALEELLRSVLSAAADGRFDLQDLGDVLSALKAVAALVR